MSCVLLLAAWAGAQEMAQPPVASDGEKIAPWPSVSATQGVPAGGRVFAFGPAILATAVEDGTIHVSTVGPVRPGRVSRTARLTFRGHTAPILCLSFLTRELLISGSEDGTLRVWDLRGDATSRVVHDHGDWVTALTWNASIQRLATACADGIVRVFKGLDLRFERETKVGEVASIAYEKNGPRLAIGGKNGAISVWDHEQLIATLQGHKGRVGALSWHPSGQFLASGSNDHSIRLWDMKKKVLVRVLGGHTNWVSALAFHPDGRSLASGSWDRTVRLWPLDESNAPWIVGRHGDAVVHLEFLGRFDLTSSASSERFHRTWDLRPSEQVTVRGGHRMPIYHASVSHDGRLLASASTDHTARLWEAYSGRPLQVLRGHFAAVTSVAMTRDGKRVATTSADGTVRVWSASSGKCTAVLRGHAEGVNFCAFSPDGTRLASGGRDDRVIVWDPVAQTKLYVLEGHTDDLKSLAFHPKGDRLASVADDGTCRIWRTEDGKSLAAFKAHPAPLHTVAWRPDGEVFVTASLDQTLRFWRTKDRKLLRTVSGFGRGVNTAAWSRDGKRVTTSSSDGLAKVIDAATGKVLHALPPHSLACVWAGFDPGGHVVYSASSDGTLRMALAETGEVIRHYPGDAGPVRGVAWISPQDALAASDDGRVRRWDLRNFKQTSTFAGTSPIAVAPDHKRFACGTATGGLKLVRLADGKELGRVDGLGSVPQSVGFTRGGKGVVVLLEDGGVVAVNDLSNPDAVDRWDVQGTGLGVGPNGQVAVCDDGGHVRIVDEKSGGVLRTLSSSGSYQCVALAPNGFWVAAGADDGKIDVWSLKDAGSFRLSPNGSAVAALAFDHQTGVLAAVSESHGLYVWDLTTTQMRRRPALDARSPGLSVALSPSPIRVVTGHEDGTFHCWSDTGAHQLVAHGFEEGAWVIRRDTLVHRGTDGGRVFVRRFQETPWRLLLPPRVTLPPASLTSEVLAVTGQPGQYVVRLHNRGNREMTGLRIMPGTMPAGTSLVPEGFLSRLSPRSRATLPVRVFGSAKGATVVVRYAGGASNPLVFP